MTKPNENALRVLLPAWVIGKEIAQANSILKMALKIRMYGSFCLSACR